MVYNNFPWPEEPTAKQLATVEAAAQAVLDARTVFPNATLADLYDPLATPPVLVKAHAELDRAVDLCYRPQPFQNERQRIEHLFGLYEKLAVPLLTSQETPTKSLSNWDGLGKPSDEVKYADDCQLDTLSRHPDPGRSHWQTIETRYAVRIANKTLVSTFRPRLILRQVSLCVGTFVPALGAPDEESWKVDYVIANTGEHRDHITSTSFAEKMFSKGGLPVPLPYAPPIAGSTFSLQPGEEKEFSSRLKVI